MFEAVFEAAEEAALSEPPFCPNWGTKKEIIESAIMSQVDGTFWLEDLRARALLVARPRKRMADVKNFMLTVDGMRKGLGWVGVKVGTWLGASMVIWT